MVDRLGISFDPMDLADLADLAAAARASPMRAARDPPCPADGFKLPQAAPSRPLRRAATLRPMRSMDSLEE